MTSSRGWQTHKLGEIAEFLSGGTPSRRVPEYFQGSVPWITGNDVVGFRTSKGRECITEDAIKNSATHLVPKGSVLFVTRTGVGKVSIADVDICISQDLTGVVPRNGVDAEYLARYLLSISAHLKTQQRGTTILGITRDVVEEIDVPLPPLPIQKRIAAILEKADAAREKRRQANQLTEQFLQSAFLEMFGDPGINTRRLLTTRLADLVREDDKINYGVVQPGDDYPGGVPIVRIGDFQGMHVDKTNLKRIDPKIEASYKRSRLVGDEVLLACVGSIGMVTLADPSLKGFNTVRAVARIRCGDNLDRLFLAFYLSTSFSQSFFSRETRTVSQPTLNIRQIEETQILVPPLKEQQKFSALVEKVERLRVKQRESEKELENLFNGLVQRAFKGELVS